MATFARAFSRQTRPDPHIYFRFLILAFTAVLARPALAQPSPLFSRIDYALDYGISSSTGLVIADFNNDGHPDLAIGAGYGIDVALGNGDGTFQPFMSFIPTGAGVNASGILASVAADFDGDGNLDLVLYYTAGVFILPGKGDGTFGPARLITQSPFTAGLAQVQAADLNGDGHPDLVILINNNLPALANATVLLNNGNGTFTSRVAFNLPSLESAVGVAIADFNRDGVPDLALITTINFGFGSAPPVVGHVYVGLGKGDGSFSSPVPALALNQVSNFITAADFNHDGASDLALLSGTTLIFLGNGDGSFRAAPSINLGGGNPGSIAVADWTKSGNLGLGIYSLVPPQGVAIMAGNGDGTFYAAGTAAFDPHSFPGGLFSSADLNGDGLPDLVALDGTSVSVFLNAGVSPTVSFVPTSAASGITSVAPASIATIYAQFPFIAAQLPSVTVNVADSAGVTRPATLFYTSPTQINLEIPDSTAPGKAVVTVASSGPPVSGIAFVRNVVPAIFTEESTGSASGIYPAAYAVTYGPDNQPQAPVLVASCQSNGCSAVPIPRPAGSRVFLELYATGIRNHVSPVTVSLNQGEQGAQIIAPQYAGAQGQFEGLDQVNIEITNLPVLPQYNLVLHVDGLVSNPVVFVVE